MLAFLNHIPYDLVDKSTEADRTFNTRGNTRTEAFPKIPHLDPAKQPWLLLSPWIDLIISSRELPSDSVHCLRFRPPFLLGLKMASTAGLILARVSEESVECLKWTFPSVTERGDKVEDVLRNGKYFPRLDTCSLKDSIIGSGPAKDVEDVCLRMATSARVTRGIRDLQEFDSEAKILLHLIPWDEQIRTEYEYRVFCASEKGKMCAISQYAWHRPWHHKDSSRAEQQRVAVRLVRNCASLHESLLKHEAMTGDMLARGFVFDVVENPETQAVRLLELDDFGAMSQCGSCLFQCIHDASTLYDRREDNAVELRVTF